MLFFYALITVFLLNYIAPADSKSTIPDHWNSEIKWKTSRNFQNQNNPISFSPNFMFGGASSATQVEGLELAQGGLSKNTTWHSWEKRHRQKENWVKKGIERKKRYKEDVQHLKNLGLNTYRFSIAWDKVESKLGLFDTKELDWYVEFCDELTKNGIRPMICFFHHTWPLWFNARGGFEKRENIYYFVEFVEQVYYYLYTHVQSPQSLEYVLKIGRASCRERVSSPV